MNIKISVQAKNFIVHSNFILFHFIFYYILLLLLLLFYHIILFPFAVHIMGVQSG
jgi:uncharacterized membrane protein